ncbi:putative E3 ubiquitin-protein ligase UBR7 isoform X3 [Gordionus sp. m RMFG-2023]|uniref:putative E3 ubiquitin-protein ligase UBR7 isoform X3 n=1 Tax=Gordionus sp. m RMFG-2023 TaxID=3053472 RepID=UPI0031FD93DC
MADSEDDVITAVDILEDEKNFEEEASALFGDFDNNICTYERGYMKRQPLYSCLTCRSISDKSAGVCLACSLNCHANHNLVELYTKRCDCGNTNFINNLCNLNNSKDDINDNKYGQNFEGLYCICKRPYPDEDIAEEEEMIQCIICEDWYHLNHIKTSNLKVPHSLEYEEFICSMCVNNNPILNDYFEYYKKGTFIKENDNSSKQIKCYYQEVIIKQNEKNLNYEDDSNKESLFWPDINWRKILCKCDNCMKIYTENKLDYIIDLEDSLTYFSNKPSNINTSFTTLLPINKSPKNVSKINNDQKIFKSQYEESLEAFSTLDRLSQNEMLHQFNTMKENLKDYLQDFVTNKRIVKRDDILEFFEREAKKPKIENITGYK